MTTHKNSNGKSNGLLSCPKYPESDVRKIHRFLAASLMSFEEKLCRIKVFAGKDINHPLFRGQVDYCLHAIGAIKHLAYLATCRQPHLLDVTDEEIEQCLQRAEYQSKRSPVPEQSETYASITTQSEERKATGNESMTTPDANSDRQHRQQLRHSSGERKRPAKKRKRSAAS